MPSIPLPNPSIPDIYSSGFNKQLYRTSPTGTEREEVNDSAVGTNIFNEETNNYSSQFQTYLTNVVNQAVTNNTINIGPRLFETIVSADGTGDYTTLGAALAAGKKKIWIRAGTYNETDLSTVISSDTIIAGEHRDSTILNLANGVSLTIGTFSQSYRTGSISVTNDDATVIGSGTAWLANAQVNQWIIFNGRAYKIAAVTDDTHIELESPYGGDDASGYNYAITSNAVTGVHLRDFTIQTQTETANPYGPSILVNSSLVISSFDNLKFRPITLGTNTVFDSAIALTGDTISQVSIRNCIIRGRYQYGIEISVDSNPKFIDGGCIIIGNIIEGCDFDGIYLGASYIICVGNFVSDCDHAGIYLGPSSFCTITGNTILNCIGGSIVTNPSDTSTSENSIIGNVVGGNSELTSGSILGIYAGPYSSSPNNPPATIIGNIGDTNSPGYGDTSFFWTFNDCGTTSRIGDVVVYSTNLGTTGTITANDKKILGVSAFKATHQYPIKVQTSGACLILVKNSASSIVFGDFLTNSTERFSAIKAALGSGNLAFAIAAETTSSGTAIIKAVLIPPRIV